MYNIRADQEKNRIYLELSGFFLIDEAQATAEEMKAAVAQVKPGFDLISDTRAFKPGSPEVAAVIGNTHTYLMENGLNRFVRIVSEDIVGQMQMRRITRQSGLDVYHVPSIEEAEAYLNE